MSFEHYLRSGDKLLRCGYTTGTCAALAAMGATRMLLTGQVPKAIHILTPKGLTVTVNPEECARTESGAFCRIKKDSGDDPDVTNGISVIASVEYAGKPGIQIDGGEGVGRVTRPGLDQPVGEAAINHVPRQMITEAVEQVCDDEGYDGGIRVVISVPGGEEVAKQTFNPNLGIEGGISILGTSGIVEPMSEQAFIDTINVEIRQAAAEGGHRLILAPGNYGLNYLHERGLDKLGIPVVKFSNYLGEALDAAKLHPFSQVLLVGHIGKLVKVAGGIMNTHSRMADCRRELFTAHAAINGASSEVCRKLMKSDTTDACLAVLESAGLKDKVMASLTEAIQASLDHRVRDKYQCGALVFSNQYGLLGVTRTAKEILSQWQEETEHATASASDPEIRNS